MKTAVSVPDDMFERAERLARHSPDEVTDALDRVVDEVGDGTDPFVIAAGRQTLASTEW
jgi:hypothetical protein